MIANICNSQLWESSGIIGQSKMPTDTCCCTDISSRGDVCTSSIAMQHAGVGDSAGLCIYNRQSPASRFTAAGLHHRVSWTSCFVVCIQSMPTVARSCGASGCQWHAARHRPDRCICAMITQLQVGSLPDVLSMYAFHTKCKPAW